MTEQRVDGIGAIINACNMPHPAKRSEAEIYGHMRDLMIKAHCDHYLAGDDHVCSGKITITAKHITFQCPLCGDSRQTLTEAP